jgi:hypothetical protein
VGNARQNVDVATRVELLAAFVVGMPLGLLLEVLATAARRGGTVHIVARANKSA